MFPEILRQGLGTEEGRDPLAAQEVRSLSSHQGQEARLLHGSSLSYCPGGFLGEQSGVVDRGQAPCLSSLSLCPFLRAPAPDVVALFHAPLYLISRTMTRFGDLRAQMDCLLALSGA